jgi:two-component system, cell cycle sensor histidine kinase and response regulator CckA
MIDINNQDLSKAAVNDYRAIAPSPGILIADDQGLILTLLKLELEPRGYTVWLAMDGDDALDLYRRNHAEIDLVVLDVQMPGLDGLQTLTALQRIDPDVVACFMTGNASAYTEDELLERGAVCVFSKPFRPAQVAHCLQDILDSAESTHLSSGKSRKKIVANAHAEAH